jgi:hypothetical protein
MNKNAFKIYRELELVKIEFQLRNFDKGTTMFWDLREQLETFEITSIFNTELNIGQMNYGTVIQDLSTMQRTFANKLFQFRCDKSFYSLESTGDDKVRFCKDCRKHVYQVETEFELEARSRAGQCTAVLFKIEDKIPGGRAGCVITDFDDELMGLPF